MTTTGRGREAVTWLFVPGSRRDRFDRAAGSGADEVILDLEDAVLPEAKDEAREGVAAWLGGTGVGWVRINGAGTPGHEQDLAAVQGLTGLRGVVVPKAEDPRLLAALREELPASAGVLALVESAAGIEQAPAIARSGAVDRLAFGSVDFALDIGAEETDEALLLARSSLVLASRLGALPAPIDGVTSVTTDDVASHEAAVRGRSLGFGGKLCIHPKQIAPALAGFRPAQAEIDWAMKIANSGDGAVSLDGMMVDAPVRLRAQRILAAAKASGADRSPGLT
jgi:citrate lyase subunit beta/citryl-CoA lyase